MDFLPLNRMLERVEIARDDSDMSLFMNLMYLGEMVTKCITAGLAAGIVENRERSRYQIIHGLVRANGLGNWAQALDEVVKGPSAQFMTIGASEIQRDLYLRLGSGNWQNEAVSLLHNAIDTYGGINLEPLSNKIELSNWFSLFTQFRNKTRAHGAPQSGKCSLVCKNVETSIRLIIENYNLFNQPWAYLHRNLSGKYRVSKITSNTKPFDYLKQSASEKLPNFPDGIYIFYDKPFIVELIISDPDLLDFYLPNGQFTPKKYELLSYITEEKKDGDSSKYMLPASQLPESETNGFQFLDPQGKVFGNIPPSFTDYVHRPSLEEELSNILLDDRHPIVTLIGRGGIGKTWLALEVLHNISELERFSVITWFSARDIDLLSTGPKQVKPHILDEKDIADEYVRLVEPAESTAKGFEKIEYFQKSLTLNPIGPTLFVFDNFETIRNPIEVFSWLDTFIRLPNKVLITTRFREFKADYHIEVSGMRVSESEELIIKTSKTLNIQHLITPDYKESLVNESDGHPYVIKILLGEIAKAGKLVNIERIVADSDEILKALFERTFNALSPAAKRVFLTICNWRSIIPQIGLEAVLLRSSNERMDVLNAIDELIRSSFIETVEAENEETVYLTVPLVARIFGKKKLSVSPMKSAIESDTILLHAFGNVRPSDIKAGIEPRLRKLFEYAAGRVNRNNADINDLLPILEFVARKHPPSWLMLASLYEESGVEDRLEKAKQSAQNCLENTEDIGLRREAWTRYQIYCSRTKDLVGEIHAIVEKSQLPGTTFQDISNNANRINLLLKDQPFELDTYEKEVLVSKMFGVIDNRINEGDATDFSRFAWLALNVHQNSKAKEYTERGLANDPSNIYINSLSSSLGLL
ncbi:MAG: NB-ARC domain-containing protein [Bellilinea sp.]